MKPFSGACELTGSRPLCRSNMPITKHATSRMKLSKQCLGLFQWRASGIVRDNSGTAIMAESAARDTAFTRVFAEAPVDGDALSVPQWQPADWSTLLLHAEALHIPRGKVLIEKN